MIHSPVTLEVTRNAEGISAVKVIMPTWKRVGSDNMIYVKLPFFGIDTYGIDDDDTEVAIKEALTCYCIAAEKYGQGLENELQRIGWYVADKYHANHTILKFEVTNHAIEAVLETGDAHALTLEMA